MTTPMYVLLLIFSLAGSDPPAVLVSDPTTGGAKRFATLPVCNAEAAKWRAAASNKIVEETNVRTVQSALCLRVN